jgi:hypothetical protein
VSEILEPKTRGGDNGKSNLEAEGKDGQERRVQKSKVRIANKYDSPILSPIKAGRACYEL